MFSALPRDNVSAKEVGIYMYVDGCDKLGRSRTRKIKIPTDQWLGRNSGTNSNDTRNQNTAMEGIENNPGSSTSEMSGQNENKFIDNFQFEGMHINIKFKIFISIN